MSKTAQTAATDTDTDTDTDDNATSKNPPHYLMWFRRDLRIHDNTALAALCERANEDNASVSAVFFLTPEQWQAHDTSLVQVDHIARTLPILAKELQSQLNITLTVQLCSSFADCIDALTTLCNDNEISCIMANHEYEGNEGDSMYKVFTPFYKKWRHTLDVSTIQMHEAPAVDSDYKIKLPSSQTFANTIDKIKSLSEKMLSDYQQTLEKNESLQHIDMIAQLDRARDAYPAGESAACQRLEAFVDDDINNYDVSRDVPHLHATSQLSAYLTIGSISPRLCYLQASKAQEKLHGNDGDNEDINRWISELAWRDFYRHVLVEKPNLIRHKAYKEATDTKINWSYNTDDFEAWCTGMTGVPLVDAAMRCLNATGFMHNRLRMVTAMFLTKDLLIDWRLGERYFMQQLIDGDFTMI